MKAVVSHAENNFHVESYACNCILPGQVKLGVETGGIFGSEMNYCHGGGFGTVRLREPMMPGDEISRIITERGDGVTGLGKGNRVAVFPRRPCRDRSFRNAPLNEREHGTT